MIKARDALIADGPVKVFTREIGEGQPFIVLHGGPDFDHTYLLPELDRLSDLFRLIYYDQRGRGRSGEGVDPDDVTIASEMADIDLVRKHFRLGPVGLVGHSWGCLLALEYANRRPEAVSHLILMNPAPASQRDRAFLRERRMETSKDDLEQMSKISSTDEYRQGDPDTVTAFYRTHFKRAFARPQDLDSIISRLRAASTKESILRSWEIEDRLINETLASDGYDLLSKVEVDTPTLIVHGEADGLIPLECAEHITEAIPGARLVVLEECGHFSYLECPGALHEVVRGFVS